MNTLCDEAEAFEDSHAYVLETKREVRSSEQVVYDCFALEMQPPLDHWPLLAGEAIQSLRSSLDHAVYAASRRKRSQFPIFLDRCEFQVKGRPMIAGVPEAIRADIERAQPCNAIPEMPRFDPLATLQALSNRDKHRELSTVACFVEVPVIGSNARHPIQFLYVGEGDRLGHKDTRVVSFAVGGPDAERVKVEPYFTYQVRVEDYPLVRSLRGVVDRVQMVLDAIEGRRRLPMLAPPPRQDDPT